MSSLSFSSYILAGGQSSRMGRDKALLPFRSVPLIAHLASVVSELDIPVTIVGPRSKYDQLGFRVIEDLTPNSGPLAGIDAALHDPASASPWRLILGCDLPHLTPQFLTFLCDRAAHSSSHAIVPLNSSGPEPLCAVYSAECASVVSAALARAIRKVTDIYADLAVDFIPPADWKPFDPHGLLFKNLNTPSDYESLE
jgi:molybdopterin-guanine dinucleotide biosynthesis protein A